ncbi:hypothetical protein [Mucilaginibacter pocheonensis]|uniref:DUF4129 domain-containing protein n=1 Tax=Mucilaginibacter pocheonensis TaxID=398050 RepID=A0ABU1T941_9SPHI|nr:hypothetical protein [Mucilaginibacter pocheonensis]MDR6941371.1 hypothetical protein [Mucilaginibacter pocheonensis]
MILQHYTWHTFLVAALILTIVWYAVAIPTFFRKEIKDFLSGNRKRVTPEPLTHEWDEEFEDEPFADDDEKMMGKSALPEGMSRLSMAQFGFAPRMIRDEDKDTQLGLVSDVLEELKSIFHILETEQGGKADFISLFGLVSAKYPKIRNTPNQQALSGYIRENLPFDISDEELDKLWK